MIEKVIKMLSVITCLGSSASLWTFLHLLLREHRGVVIPVRLEVMLVLGLRVGVAGTCRENTFEYL